MAVVMSVAESDASDDGEIFENNIATSDVCKSFDAGISDVGQLQGAFCYAVMKLSSANSKVNSSALCNLNEATATTATEIISNAVKFVLNGYTHDLTKWTKELAQITKERMHSVLFYFVLKNNSIECDEADQYYSSLLGRFPLFDWHFYFSLVKSCQWTTQYVECVHQMSDTSAAIVLESSFLAIKNKPSSHDHVVIHSLIQTIMCKLFEEENPSTPPDHMLFNFPFKCETNDATDESSVSESTSSTSRTDLLLNILLDVIDYLGSRDKDDTLQLEIILLNGLITAFNLCIKNETSFNKVMLTDNFKRYCTFTQLYFESENVLRSLKNELESFQYIDFIRNFALKEKYEWHVGYHLFLLHGQLQDLKNMSFWDSECGFLSALDAWVETLFSNHPLKKVQEPVIDEYVKMLVGIMSRKKEGGAKYAFATLVNSAEFIVKEHVLHHVCQHCQFLNENEGYLLLMRRAMTTAGPEKENLSSLFKRWYYNTKQKLQRNALEAYIYEFGVSTYMKSDDYSETVKEFFGRVSQLDHAIKILLQLCLQSPEETLKAIICRVLDAGCKNSVFVQVLQAVPYVCSFKKSSTAEPLLIEAMQPHFTSKEKWSTAEEKSAVLLIQQLLQVFPSSDAFSRYDFINSCVLPIISSSSDTRVIQFFLELLNNILTDAVSTGYVSWLNKFEPTFLVAFACDLMNNCIIHSNGRLKSEVVYLLNMLLELHKQHNAFEILSTQECQVSLLQHLSTLSPLVLLYVLDFIEEPHLDESSLPLKELLVLCIVRDKGPCLLDNYIAQQKDTSSQYPLLMFTTAQTLTHLTSAEFCKLSKLLTELQFLSPASAEIIDEESSNATKGELKILSSIEILSDAVLFLKDQNIVDSWSYVLQYGIIPVFQSHIKDICSNATISCKVFSEFGRLIEDFEPFADELFVLQSSLLRALLKPEGGASVVNGTVKENLMSEIMNLPDFVPKNELLELL